jgi:cell division septation protein DedD
VLVPDETYFTSNSQPSKSTAGSGAWLNISNLPDEAFANDYGMRMFKYDESLGNVQITVSKPTPPTTTFTMRVGPLFTEQANTLCDTVRSGGFSCIVAGGGAEEKRTPLNTASETDESQINTSQDYWITLGTFANNAEAEYYWMFIKEDNNDILNQLQYDISTISKNNEFGDESVKLRTGPFSTKQRATQLCNVMRYKNIACLVAD